MRCHLVYTLHFLLFTVWLLLLLLLLHSSLLLLWHTTWTMSLFTFTLISWTALCTVHCAVCARLRFISPLSFRISGANVFVFISFFFPSSSLCAKLQPPRVLNNWARCQWAANSSSELQPGAWLQGGVGGVTTMRVAATMRRRKQLLDAALTSLTPTRQNPPSPLPPFPPFLSLSLPLSTLLPYTHLPLCCH